MGQLAADYFRTFSELPSETLREAVCRGAIDAKADPTDQGDVMECAY